MPTYEYRREDGTTFDVFQRMSDDPLTVDPETGQKVTRVIGGGAGLIFKGDGFYLTDYARKGKESGGGAKAATSGASGGEAGVDTAASSAESTTSESTAKSTSDSGSTSGSGGTSASSSSD
ncbi:MAG: FmdB family zinc ribbon protein [Bacteroidota bacterium]